MIALLLTALSHASCPTHFILARGVQPDGTFGCFRYPPDDGSDENAVPILEVRRGRVWCRRGSVPIVASEREVRCWHVARSGES